MRSRPKSAAEVPATAPVFPLSGALVLPRASQPLSVFEPRYLDLVDAILGGNRLLVLVQPEDASAESPQGDVALREVGALTRITHFEDIEDGRYLVVVEGLCRVRLGAEVPTDALYRRFRIDPTPYGSDFSGEMGEREVDRKRLLQVVRAYADFADIDVDWEQVEQTETGDLVNICCMMSPYGAAEKQMLLEADTLAARAEFLIALAEMEMARGKAGQTLQ